MSTGSPIIGALGIGDMMGMRVSFGFDYSSLQRSGNAPHCVPLALACASDLALPRIDEAAP